MKTEEKSASSSEAWKKFLAFLKAGSHRATRSRQIILEHALSRHDHFRADEVASALGSGRNRVSRGTVYRTLALMVEAGLLRMIRDSDTHMHYEHIHGHPHHEHMICEQCGAFTEFDDKQIARYLQTACKRHDFSEKSHRITIFGICGECNRQS